VTPQVGGSRSEGWKGVKRQEQEAVCWWPQVAGRGPRQALRSRDERHDERPDEEASGRSRGARVLVRRQPDRVRRVAHAAITEDR